jgi:predicted DNA-binding WGR domain protein
MQYEFIGWNSLDGHDKVWGVIVLERDINKYVYDPDHKVCVFWGRRGKKLQTKVSVESQRDINKLIGSKTKKGYDRVNLTELNVVYPEFEKDLHQTAFWATLKG